MRICKNSNLYLILSLQEGWDSWECDIRSTENGARDWLSSISVWRGGNIAVCQIPGQEILDRAIYVRKQTLVRPLPVLSMKDVLAAGTPLNIQLKNKV